MNIESTAILLTKLTKNLNTSLVLYFAEHKGNDCNIRNNYKSLWQVKYRTC